MPRQPGPGVVTSGRYESQVSDPGAH